MIYKYFLDCVRCFHDLLGLNTQYKDNFTVYKELF